MANEEYGMMAYGDDELDNLEQTTYEEDDEEDEYAEFREDFDDD